MKWREIILIVAIWVGFFFLLFARVFLFNCILLSPLNCLSMTAHYTTSIISFLKFGIYSEASWSTWRLSCCLPFLSTVNWIRWVLYVSECLRDTRKNRQHASCIKRHPERLILLYNSEFISFPQLSEIRLTGGGSAAICRPRCSPAKPLAQFVNRVLT